MKKVLIYMLIFCILIYSVIAANVYESKDFTEHPGQLVFLEERDVVRLNWDDKEHKLMVRKIYLEKGKVDLTAFIEGSEVPYYVTITPQTSLQLDFDQNLEYEMKISIFNILEDGKVIALKFINLEKFGEEPLQVITGAAIKEQDKFYQNFVKNKFYLIIGLICLISLSVWKKRFFLRTYRRIKKIG